MIKYALGVLGLLSAAYGYTGSGFVETSGLSVGLLTVIAAINIPAWILTAVVITIYCAKNVNLGKNNHKFIPPVAFPAAALAAFVALNVTRQVLDGRIFVYLSTALLSVWLFSAILQTGTMLRSPFNTVASTAAIYSAWVAAAASRDIIDLLVKIQPQLPGVVRLFYYFVGYWWWRELTTNPRIKIGDEELFELIRVKLQANMPAQTIHKKLIAEYEAPSPKVLEYIRVLKNDPQSKFYQ